MAFRKTGDAMPVLAYYDKDGDKEKCPKCGSKLVVVAVEAEDNELVCENCDIDESIENE